MEEEVLNERIAKLLDSWAEIAVRQSDAVDLLHRVYQELFDEKIKKNCGDCYVKAFQKIQKFVYLHSRTNNKTIIMSELRKDRKFLLKKGVVLQTTFGGDALTNDNMTDEVASALLLKTPALVKHFEKFPANDKGELQIEDKPKAPAKETKPKNAPKAEKVAAVDPEFKEETEVEGKTATDGVGGEEDVK